MKLSHATHRFAGPAITALGLTLTATAPVHSTEFVLSLAVTVNGLVHTWDYAYEKSLARDSDIVALLATLPDGARIPEIAHAMGVRNEDISVSLLRLLHKRLITVANDTVPVPERLFRLAA
ncbi:MULTISPECIES: hypothetical protein [unclassified Streptomyces]|uniref:hypothetical protein n=1 Tax=unclassified Streptomyces TaxID=2593676 RepID=UPI002E2C6CE3|nr:hypothetical protein [Streptomyces sp. NBC_00223]